MLIENTNPKKDDIVSIKLPNGDELIGKLEENYQGPGSKLILSKPMAMMLTQDPSTGRAGVQMVPFFMLGADRDGKFPINSDQIVCIVLSNGEAKAEYIKQTSSIVIPKTTGKLIT